MHKSMEALDHERHKKISQRRHFGTTWENGLNPNLGLQILLEGATNISIIRRIMREISVNLHVGRAP